MPRYSALEMFIAGDAASIARKETFERYRCAHQARPVIKAPTPEPCGPLLSSMSAIIHQGALGELIHLPGNRRAPGFHPPKRSLLGRRGQPAKSGGAQPLILWVFGTSAPRSPGHRGFWDLEVSGRLKMISRP